ncbi:MAG TPA: hypothetical protein VH054_28955 [Polyangiaceae bacterium]|nr:hypothetical protein [Polyangiaceae bacterium]
MRDDWESRMRGHDARVASHDEVRIDENRQIIAFLRAGMLMLEAPAELVGTWFPELGLFRWWWSGKEHTLSLTPSRLDAAFAHAQKTDLRALLTRQHQLDGEEDATMLCRVAAYFAHATGMVRQQRGDRVSYYAVFAAATRAPIVPDLDIVRTLPPPAVAPTRPSAPPPPPDSPRAVREPARELLVALVRVANDLLRHLLEDHARRALLIVNVDTSREKARFFVTLVAATDDGDLAAVDTTRELLDATGTMLGEDARGGNGRWRKLVVHFDCAGGDTAISRCDVMG